MVSVAAISTCKDEADIAEAFVRHTLAHVDFMIVLDNGSTDGTREILAELARDLPLTVDDDPEVGYYQARRMTALAGRAADMGANWVVPADFDEFWVPRRGDTVKQALEGLEDWFGVATAVLYNHVSTSDDPADPDPLRRMGWRLREPGAMPKVACRPRVDAAIVQGNHDAHYPTARAETVLSVHHYPHRSAEQTILKTRNGAAAYAAAPDLPEHLGDHWRKHGQFTDEQLAGLFREWWYFENPEADKGIVFDPLPVVAPA